MSMLPSSLRRVPAPVAVTLIGLFLLSTGCDDDENPTSFEGEATVTLTLNGLEPIVGGLNYQAWLVVGNSSTSYGYPLFLFNIDGAGRMVHPTADTVLSGPFQADVDPKAVLGVAISLESSDTLRTVSSPVFILGGENLNGTANLTAEDWIAFNRDLSSAAGSFVFATPTDDDPDNELTGVWFTDATGAAPALQLPRAPKGWIYEGWIEVDGQPLSTGKFEYPNEPDSSSVYSGDLGGFLYPGEDFVFGPPAGVTFPIDPSGAVVFISVEPGGPWDVFPSSPFFLRILEAQVSQSPSAGVSYGLTSRAGSLPSGTAVIQSP